MPEHEHGWDLLTFAGPVLGLIAITTYLVAVGSGHAGVWGRRRTGCWVAGCLAATLAVSGPIAAAAHERFAAHMVTHLLVGMLAPLLLVLGAPVSLLLRALPVRHGRRVVRLLGGHGARLVTEPVVAALLNVGGLWLLYTTRLYAWTHTSSLSHMMVHLHVFVAGYLFTVALVSVDPLRHRRGFGHRALVLVLALAAHDILAKHLYASPPLGVEDSAGQLGALVMYYGGDVVDLAMLVVLGARWYRVTRPRNSVIADREPRFEPH